MFGTFQQSHLRIELTATAEQIGAALLEPARLREWLKFQRFPAGLPDRFTPGYQFTSYGGWIIPVQHTVELVEAQRLRLLLAQGIDGFHAWAWGDGWVQSELEGVSLVPIGLAQSASLALLRQYLSTRAPKNSTP
ncbi:MAG: hypothetical protein RLZZ511_1057 [Cyanobacteriota bacterium]|jgi:hypothetical protein